MATIYISTTNIFIVFQIFYKTLTLVVCCLSIQKTVIGCLSFSWLYTYIKNVYIRKAHKKRPQFDAKTVNCNKM